MLERSLSAKVSKAAFFQAYNDIDIFIEDTAEGYAKIFSKLMGRRLQDKYKIENVYPLGRRDQVIEACGKDQESRNRTRMYIVDGDLYLLTGEQLHLKGLYVLPRYCIENHLICDNALVRFLEEEDSVRGFDELKKELNLELWVESIKADLLELFVVYAVSKALSPHITTVKFGYKGLVSCQSGNIDSGKVANRINLLTAEIIAHAGQDRFDEKYSEIKQKLSGSTVDCLKYISGKDILFPLLMLKLRTVTKFNATNISFKHRLSNVCNIDSFTDIEESIVELN